MKVSKKEIKKVIENPNTKVLIEWLGSMLKITKGVIISDKFFHKTHTKRDRVVLVELIKNNFNEIKSIETNYTNSTIINIKH